MSYPTPGQGGQPGYGPPPSPYQPSAYPGGQGGVYGTPSPAPPGAYPPAMGPPPGGAYPPAGPPPGGAYPPPGGGYQPPRKSNAGKIIGGVIAGVVVLVGVGALGLYLLNAFGSSAPSIGDCFDDPANPADLEIVDCDSAEAAYEATEVDDSPAGREATVVAAQLGCGFKAVFWEEENDTGDLVWVACAEPLDYPGDPAVGDCLDGTNPVPVPCDDPAAVEEVVHVATDGLPVNASEEDAQALQEQCPDPNTNSLYTSWEQNGDTILWMMCTQPAGGGPGPDPTDPPTDPPDDGEQVGPTDLRAGDCVNGDTSDFRRFPCDHPDAVEEVVAVDTNPSVTPDTREDVQEAARDLCGTDWDFYYDNWSNEPGEPIDYLFCTREL